MIRDFKVGDFVYLKYATHLEGVIVEIYNQPLIRIDRYGNSVFRNSDGLNMSSVRIQGQVHLEEIALGNLCIDHQKIRESKLDKIGIF